MHLDGPPQVLLLWASKKTLIAGYERLTSQIRHQTGIREIHFPGTDKHRQVLRFEEGLPLKILYEYSGDG